MLLQQFPLVLVGFCLGNTCLYVCISILCICMYFCMYWIPIYYSWLFLHSSSSVDALHDYHLVVSLELCSLCACCLLISCHCSSLNLVFWVLNWSCISLLGICSSYPLFLVGSEGLNFLLLAGFWWWCALGITCIYICFLVLGLPDLALFLFLVSVYNAQGLGAFRPLWGIISEWFALLKL